MRGIRKRIPSPGLVVAVIALVAALGGSAYAGARIGLGGLSDSAKNKTVGVGKLTYVRSFASIPLNANTNGTDVGAFCPKGTFVIGGGIKVGNDAVQIVNDSHPTTNGWVGTVYNLGSVAHGATTTAICAPSRDVTGAP